jgi:hypothetical protein
MDVQQAVKRLACEHGDWIPILRAACEVARKAEALSSDFAGSWVLEELYQHSREHRRIPGLRSLVSYGLLQPSGESTRGGNRRYYRMPDRDRVERALRELPPVAK